MQIETELNAHSIWEELGKLQGNSAENLPNTNQTSTTIRCNMATHETKAVEKLNQVQYRALMTASGAI